nr:hypothetical protein Iba_chr13aCG12970 [Ipomoea batatas]GMD76911.1 hypothetical protein Iba_chr13bCG14780 [Ipomoea batatas]GME05999.1 hypothetical protein Iba_scaffold3831CG0400 [Ipomoea batatas]GME10702.1 hypothetical protein Iba_scaffold10445CG0020 [Ipomoea batatas]
MSQSHMAVLTYVHYCVLALSKYAEQMGTLRGNVTNPSIPLSVSHSPNLSFPAEPSILCDSALSSRIVRLARRSLPPSSLPRSSLLPSSLVCHYA